MNIGPFPNYRVCYATVGHYHALHPVENSHFYQKLAGLPLILNVLTVNSYRFKLSFLDNFFGKLVFSMAIVSSVVTQLCTMQYLQDNNDITTWCNEFQCVVSISFITFGCYFLFKPSQNNNIGSHDRGMGLVVSIITISVVGLEIVLIVMVFLRKNLSISFVIYLGGFAYEKIIQVVLYILIRRCKPDPCYRRGAVFYFKFLSFLNFTFWLNSISFSDVPIYDELSHDHILQYVDQTFKALIIDYRLLCAFLFLEHAFKIQETIDDDEHEHVNNEVDSGFQMPRKRYLYTAIGLSIGLFFLILEVINAAQFWNKCFPNFVNIFPIVVDICLVVLGYLLLRNVKISVLHDEKVDYVLLMVTSMGAASIVYLFCFGLLSLSSFEYDQSVSYVRWSACVYFARAFSLLVLLVVYAGIPVSTFESRQNHNTKNYLFVSALCCGMFARFIGSILNEFKGTMHETAVEHLDSKKFRTLRDLFDIGPLFQLATSLHLALHFLLMSLRLRERPNKPRLTVNKQARVDGHGEPIRGDYVEPIKVNYGTLSANGVARQPDGDVDVHFRSSGVQIFERDDDERTRLLPPYQRC
ncbi:Hypothetical predicted protein [Paramuricea clavata]|uniref:Uncharacterized protein n=1 Tax=Paramuricea clavata TaxID=317549 RepID=A0A7D9HWI0_PARCT|nr:Hypothetical predicted protein [Paramuricea clavata]